MTKLSRSESCGGRAACAAHCGAPPANASGCRCIRSSKHIYAQVIDDDEGVTLASASSIEKTAREGLKTGAGVDAAKAVGKLIAERAKEKGIKDVVFDRGGYLYHGRVKALAEAAREGGLNF